MNPDTEGELDVLLLQYEQLREEIRALSVRRSRRMLGGLSAAGIILGYAFVDRGDPRAVVLLPFVFVFLFFIQIEDSGWVARAASELCRIEDRIPVEEFRFSSHHGILSPGRPSVSRRIALANVYGLLFLAYVGASVGAVWGVMEHPLPLLPFADSVPYALGAVYTLLVPAMAYTMVTYLRELDWLRREAFGDAG